MEAMGGKIWAESDGPNQGATFILQLPLTETTASEQPNSQNTILKAAGDL